MSEPTCPGLEGDLERSSAKVNRHNPVRVRAKTGVEGLRRAFARLHDLSDVAANALAVSDAGHEHLSDAAATDVRHDERYLADKVHVPIRAYRR